MQFFKKLFYKPLSITLKITSSNGFHLRPIAQFTQLAKGFSSIIEASFKHQKVNAKKINTLLSLSLEKGDSFELHAKGADAKEGLLALEICFDTLMKNEVEISLQESSTHTYEGKSIHGEIISKGIAIGPLALYHKIETTEKSSYSFEKALAQSIADLSQVSSTIEVAQKALLLSISEEVKDINGFEAHILEVCKTLENSKHASKISDYQDIRQRVKSYLGFKNSIIFPKEDFILLAHDLFPSEIELLTQSKVQGVILQNNSIYSHTAILLRSRDIASVIIKDEILMERDEVLLDSYAGVIIANPSKEDIHKATLAQEKALSEEKKTRVKRFAPAVSKIGQKIRVYANVTDISSAQMAKEEGAEGIGLLRSEFLFQDTKPSLEMQTQSYKEIFSIFEDITVRMLDVGGDKALPYIKIDDENNPFLGIRGIRLFKTHPQILKEQFHAIFLASEHKAIKIMFPMVSSVEEFIESKAIAKEVAYTYKIDISAIQFGIMIEVPSVLFLLEDFNKVVDFYSIGSNDLAQYIFAIERTHPLLKIDPLSPVIFSSIAHILKSVSKPISICGELASNEKAIAQLIHLGLKTLSVSAKSVASTKETIRHV